MPITDQQILHKAAQLRAARRRRTKKRCEVCGAEFEGISQRRYCSDRCRVAASRARRTQDEMDTPIDSSVRPENLAADRKTTNRPLSSEEFEAVFAQMMRRREQIRQREGALDDSAEILRQQREARTRHLADL